MIENMSKNMIAFLDMIAWSEIGTEVLEQSDNGYNVLVGSLPGKVKLFHDYADHPRRIIKVNDRLWSSAAGRYQILRRNFDHYKKVLSIPDFGPDSQKKIAIRLIAEQGATGDIEAGRIGAAIDKVRNIWASLPGAGYGQHEQKMAHIVDQYQKHGGTVA